LRDANLRSTSDDAALEMRLAILALKKNKTPLLRTWAVLHRLLIWRKAVVQK
jgi:hypothetical protein